MIVISRVWLNLITWILGLRIFFLFFLWSFIGFKFVLKVIFIIVFRFSLLFLALFAYLFYGICENNSTVFTNCWCCPLFSWFQVPVFYVANSSQTIPVWFFESITRICYTVLDSFVKRLLRLISMWARFLVPDETAILDTIFVFHFFVEWIIKLVIWRFPWLLILDMHRFIWWYIRLRWRNVWVVIVIIRGDGLRYHLSSHHRLCPSWFLN